MSLIVQEIKIAEKKSKSTKLSMQQTTDGEQPTKSAANQHRVHGVICNVLLVRKKKEKDFSDLKSKTTNKLFRSKLTRVACEPRAGLISCLANRD